VECVRGYLQTYDWGPVDGLAAWTAATGGPQAELWFGSHGNGASPRRDGRGPATTPLTILTKILAAALPLSIQIHPPAAMAADMFAGQHVDSQAPRLVSDPHGKAEILIAFEPFVILEGFRDPTLSARAFAQLGPDMAPVAEALAGADLPGAITWLLAMAPADVPALASRLPEALAMAGMSSHTVDTINEVVTAFPGDPGVFVAALLNARTLQPGQAVYVDPGTVHAYVRGLGLEVMTNSDNVLRLGLTSKTVAVEAALAALDLSAQPYPCDPQDVDGVRSYAPPGAPFRVELVRDATVETVTGHARIVVCLDGAVSAADTVLSKGDAVLLAADDPAVPVRVTGVAIVAHHITVEDHGAG